VLSEVLTTTGTPVRRSKAVSIAATSGSRSGLTGLDARGAVDVDDRGDPLAPAVAHAMGEEHVGTGKRAVEELRRTVLEHHRRHRANCSRPLTSLRRSTFAARRGSASSERRPSARGPYSLAPWNHATTPSSASTSATAAATSRGRSYGTRAVRSAASSSSSSHERP
jgi:hypothetical protein